MKFTRIASLLLLFLTACRPPPPSATRPPATSTSTTTSTPRPSPSPSHTPPPTATRPACTETRGILVEAAFYSAIQDEDIDYLIYLPPCYAPSGRRYPYVILLHGMSYDRRQWLDLNIVKVLDEGITLKLLSPMAVVMPDGGSLANVNHFAEGQSFESVVVDELIPALEAEYCLLDERAIGGISRGGFWAFEIALRHPEQFSAVGGHSPVFGMDEVPGPYNPLRLVESIPAARLGSLRIWLDIGANEYAETNVARFAEALDSRGIAHEYTVHPTGGHDDAYWATQIAEYLIFYGRAWPQSPDLLPACAR